jgi:hypothetical protein
VFLIGCIAGLAEEVANADRMLSVAVSDDDRRVKRRQRDREIRRVGGHASIAGSEDGVGAVTSADRAAPGTG